VIVGGVILETPPTRVVEFFSPHACKKILV